MPAHSKPTLMDVAAKAGVSTATVSRCLNFPDQVTEKTRKKITKTINELGYSPNFGARAMAANKTHTIGAVIPTMENAFFARGLQAFQEELMRFGYTLLVASSNYRADVEAEQIKSLVARGADGLLLIGHQRDPEIYKFLETQKTPVLVSWAYDATQPRYSVGFNNRTAMQKMAEEVLSKGHKKLAFVGPETPANDRVRARLDGVKDAMRARTLDPDTLSVIETPYGIENGASAFDALMKKDPKPTAILCANDVLAAGALRAARLAELSVPRDVSIIGFDDIEMSRVVHPTLTTVHVPHQNMGRQAAQVLVGMVDGTLPERSLELPVEIVIRESLGPAPE